ncbi:protein BIG GRAIN 1-like A [Solanum lycopersicum]|uniref:Protein BIG GRAIN 1-like B n=1 Tax=Solanum lycopersicum TaxID=4081 RepID=A0A3Q7HPZ1_SOLLC|nr:protein BIG GRAIN 1-like A [Solanum lycopersicum]
MYNMEKDKLCRRHHKNPSFSSSLLDEIYRSIDGYDQRREDFKSETRKQSNIGVKPKVVANIYNKKKSVEDEEIASFRRACLIEKWMEKKVKDKTRRGPCNELDSMNYDSLFFSSTSSESNSGTLSASSSEPDSFYSEKSSTTTTCFAASKTRSIRRASVSPRRGTKLYSFDNQQLQANKNEETNFIKSKSTALKMYNNLKKVKQPISPGGRLTNFLTSIFNNKSKNLKDPNRGDFHEVEERSSKSSSICSSFSRSCLSKTPPKFSQTTVKRTVRFNPVSVIVDEDCRPCGHKSIYGHDSDNLHQPKSLGNAEKNRKFEVTKVDSYKKNDYIVDYIADEEEDDDAASCSSSDLFEIDHLAFFGNKRFCDELPVYETTHVDTNRGIASGFIH